MTTTRGACCIIAMHFLKHELRPQVSLARRNKYRKGGSDEDADSDDSLPDMSQAAPAPSASHRTVASSSVSPQNRGIADMLEPDSGEEGSAVEATMSAISSSTVQSQSSSPNDCFYQVALTAQRGDIARDTKEPMPSGAVEADAVHSQLAQSHPKLHRHGTPERPDRSSR